MHVTNQMAAQPWQVVELSFEVPTTSSNPYLDVVLSVDFSCGATHVVRPGFWDGGTTWRVRFAAPHEGTWDWVVRGLVGEDPATGQLHCGAGESRVRAFAGQGLLQMSADGRTVEYSDGTPLFLVCDTVWALPWRATPDQVQEYAEFRRTQGFNAALLMSMQPDMGAVGPLDRTQDEGFDIAFSDLAQGHLNHPRLDYFARLDEVLSLLRGHGIVPVLQPVFQGFGWKGLDAAGGVIPPDEYARYCTMLVARYGAEPIIYLVGADGTGREPQIAAGGAAIEAADDYGQPTGVHYAPHAVPDADQEADWLDFQWCQTGHAAEHLPERVAEMWRNRPPKGVANGEPTYENTGTRGLAADWWQGHEGWSNLCAGGTMGAFYGAASLWQRRLHAEEAGHEDFYLDQAAGWREALAAPGAEHVGRLGQLLASLPTGGMEPDWTTAVAARGLRANGWRLIYRGSGQPLQITDDSVPSHLTIVDPRSGAVMGRDEIRSTPHWVLDTDDQPRLYLFTEWTWVNPLEPAAP